MTGFAKIILIGTITNTQLKYLYYILRKVHNCLPAILHYSIGI